MKIMHRLSQSGWRKTLLPLCGILAVGIPAIFGARRWAVLQKAASYPGIYENVFIYGVPVSDYTEEEAAEALRRHFQPQLDKNIIRVLYNGAELTAYTFAEFEARYDFTQAAAQAWRYGREGTASERYEIISRKKGANITAAPRFYFNEARVEERVNFLAKNHRTAPVNAALKMGAGGVETAAEKEGRVMDAKALIDKIQTLLAVQTGGSAEAVFHTETPEYTRKDMDFVISAIGEYDTAFPGGNAPRAANIELAASRIHNQTVYPGQVFSTAEWIGSARPGSGYQRAVVIVNGKAEEDEGGGVCQVVSTLYNAVLFAELPVVERHNHSIPVSYTDFGLDAAVAGDYYDLKFKNDTPHPLLITCEVRDNKITVKLLGFERHSPGRRLEFISELVETLRPDPPSVRRDAGLPPGQEIVTRDARDGFKFDVYKYVYDGGRAVGKEKVNTSVYKPVRGEKTVGGSY